MPPPIVRSVSLTDNQFYVISALFTGDASIFIPQNPNENETIRNHIANIRKYKFPNTSHTTGSNETGQLHKHKRMQWRPKSILFIISNHHKICNHKLTTSHHQCSAQLHFTFSLKFFFFIFIFIIAARMNRFFVPFDVRARLHETPFSVHEIQNRIFWTKFHFFISLFSTSLIFQLQPSHPSTSELWIFQATPFKCKY